MRLFNIALLVCILCTNPATASEHTKEHNKEQASIQDLVWLIGKWEYADKSLSGSYSDIGIRNCTYALRDKYILCESKGLTNSDKERSYLFYFNYNSRNNRFEMTALFSDYPSKVLYQLQLSDDNHRIEITSENWNEDGLGKNNSATIQYNGSDTILWEIYSLENDVQAADREVVFRDIATRVKP